MIMTSLWRHTWDVGTYFDMYGKRRPLAIVWYQFHVSWDFIFKFTRGGNHPPPPPWEDVLQKRLCRTGVNWC